MAQVAAILRYLARAVRRDLGTFRSIQVNNFFLFVYLLMYGAFESGVAPTSAYPFLVVLGVLLLFPLSSDPLARIPASRLGLWPLSRKARFGLRVVSVALSPVVWFALAIAWRVRASLTLAVIGLAGLGQGIRFSKKHMTLGRPKGLPHLLRNHLRQMFSVLDIWLAVVISVSGTLWRVFGRNVDAESFPILAMLVALAMSTYAQCLFALDGRGGMTRYRLLPMRHWQILLSKDVAYLGLLAVLVAPLSFMSGMTFGLTALAIGHYPSTRVRLPLQRGRFAGGRFLFGAVQMVMGAMLGFSVRQSPLYLLGAMAIYGASLLL